MGSYKDAGVDISANTRWVTAIQAAMASTFGPRVCKQRDGGFAGLFRLDYDEQLFRRNYQRPVLVSCADGVGTKVLLAIACRRLVSIGIDLVAMNVNDLITMGGEPLFFLDYLGVHKLDPQALRVVIEGVAEGCRQAGCALLGGETAEMPAMYRRNEFDLAGFAVGVLEYGRIVDGSRVRHGDLVVGLPSSGVHSNGFTLVRKLLADSNCAMGRVDDLLGETPAEAFLRPTRIYVKAVRCVLAAYRVKRVVSGMAHITGGGLRENIARILPRNCDAVLRKRAWQAPPVFEFLRRLGAAESEMFKVFNMGIGYVFIVKRLYVRRVIRVLRHCGEVPVVIGTINPGSGRVRIR